MTLLIHKETIFFIFEHKNFSSDVMISLVYIGTILAQYLIDLIIFKITLNE